MIKPLLLTLLLATYLSAQVVSASQVIIVASDSWENFVTKDGSGYYLDLLRLAYPSPQYELKLSILPYSRALHLIKNQQADIVLGIWANEYHHSLLSKYPVEVDLYDAVSIKGQAQINSVESFIDLRVIGRVGHGIDRLLDSPKSYEEYTDIGIMLKMIQHGRADILLDYSAELELAMNLQELNDVLALQKNVLAEYAYFGFCESQKCLDLKATFDQSFIKLHSEGFIESLLIKNQQSTNAVPPLKMIEELYP